MKFFSAPSAFIFAAALPATAFGAPQPVTNEFTLKAKVEGSDEMHPVHFFRHENTKTWYLVYGDKSPGEKFVEEGGKVHTVPGNSTNEGMKYLSSRTKQNKHVVNTFLTVDDRENEARSVLEGNVTSKMLDLPLLACDFKDGSDIFRILVRKGDQEFVDKRNGKEKCKAVQIHKVYQTRGDGLDIDPALFLLNDLMIDGYDPVKAQKEARERGYKLAHELTIEEANELVTDLMIPDEVLAAEARRIEQKRLNDTIPKKPENVPEENKTKKCRKRKPLSQR